MINETIAILAISAALWSAVMAFLSWYYNRELSKAAIALMEVKVDGKRLSKDKLSINFLFIFKNAGKEAAKISELRLGHVNVKAKIFEQVGKKPILNPIHADSMFNYSNSFSISIDPQIPDDKVGEVLPNIVGSHAMIIFLKYKGKSIFSKEQVQKFFIGYEGKGAVYQLTEDEYKMIEGTLPQEFKVDK